MKLKCFESTDSNGTEQYLIPLEDGSFIAVPKATTYGDALRAVKEQPSIDIVRCKECKYYEAKEDWCYWRDEAITADDFCSYGERAEPPIDGRELTIGNGTIPKGYGEREEEKNCPEYYDPSAWE